ncbi:MAG: insulinase family protein [bacterium]
MKMKRLVSYLFVFILVGIFLSCQTDEYQVGSTYHGFKLTEKRFVKEVNADCYYFEHVKSGARLLKIAADDPNKTFCIGFKTTPETDCGTPHIMEHSVLNGSENFPVKSPFDVLTKGSLNTFLNAMTGSDFTMYPVASMNDKDFFNLMHVYLDAVLKPRIYDDPRIFKQEGWHYELKDMDSPVEYKGVVYNEMKGAFSSATRELGFQIDKILFPDNCYGNSSGGYPPAIPELTYEQFLDFHRKYYHPSNSYIFLYGNADLDEELSFIDEKYLSEFEKSDDIASISFQKPFEKMKEASGYYPVPVGSSTDNQTYLSLSWIIGEGRDRDLCMALDILSEALVNHESAPVRLALQKAGIGREVRAYNSEQKQNVFQIRVQNADPSDTDKFKSIVMKTLKETAEKGLDKETIEGIINRMEFRLREGNTPHKGLVYLFNASKGWLYTDDPFLSLEWEQPLEIVKTALETDLLESIIKEHMLNNPHSLLFTLKPKPGLESKRNEKIKTELAAYKKSLSQKEKEQLIKETQELIEFQKREDSPEALATIPRLEIEDINPEASWYQVSEKKLGDIPVLYYDAFTNDIVYIKFLFDTRVLSQEMIPYAALLSEVLGSLNTENYSYGDLDNALNIHTGGFNTYLNTYLKNRSDEQMMPPLLVSSKAMNAKTNKLFELTNEILNHSVFTDKDRLKTILTRHQSRLDASVKGNGMGYALTRLTSYYSNQGMFNELTKGLEYYWFITDLVDNYDQKADKIISNLKNAASTLFNKNNLIVAVTCDKDDFSALKKEIEQFAQSLSQNDLEKQSREFSLKKKNEGISTASKVQYVLQGYDFKDLGYEWNGKIRVLNQILSREWLHKQIRVIGGAYGGFSNFAPTGQVFFGSYRDPNLKETLENFENTPEFLQDFEPEKDLMTRFIIGTISNMDRPLTPSGEGDQAVSWYLENVTRKDVQTERDNVLETTPEDIQNMKSFVQDILKQNVYCVYGNEEKIKAQKELFGEIIKLEK